MLSLISYIHVDIEQIGTRLVIEFSLVTCKGFSSLRAHGRREAKEITDVAAEARISHAAFICEFPWCFIRL